jgi:hypothetical protein
MSLELRALREIATLCFLSRGLFPMAERDKGSHDAPEVDTMTHRCLFDGIFFGDAAIRESRTMASTILTLGLKTMPPDCS